MFQPNQYIQQMLRNQLKKAMMSFAPKKPAPQKIPTVPKQPRRAYLSSVKPRDYLASLGRRY